MKKDVIFSAALLIIGAALAAFRATGFIAHVIISLVGLVCLIVYTVLERKSWPPSIPELITRICYAVALISGVALMRIESAGALAAAIGIAHKLFAVLFVVFLVISLVLKARKSKKEN